jgi:hypothetical protein
MNNFINSHRIKSLFGLCNSKKIQTPTDDLLFIDTRIIIYYLLLFMHNNVQFRYLWPTIFSCFMVQSS